MSIVFRLFALILVFTVAACGGGGGGGGGGNGGNSIPIAALDVFPISNQYRWYYDSDTTPARFGNSFTLASRQVFPMEFSSGAQEYYSTTSEQLMFFGVYFPSVVVQTTNGSQSYTADLKLDQPLILYSKNWQAGFSSPFMQIGSVDINPTFGSVSAVAVGDITYNGVESIMVSGALRHAHSINLDVTYEVEVEGQLIDIDLQEALWLVEEVGLVQRVENGVESELTRTENIPNKQVFLTQQGASVLPSAQYLFDDGAPVLTNAFQTTVSQTGTDWLNLFVVGNFDYYLLQPDSTDLPVGEYEAELEFFYDAQTSFTIDLIYTVE